MKRALKWIGIAVGAIVIVALLVIFGVSEYRWRETFDVPAAQVVIPSDSASLALGRHVFETRGCEGCHGQGLAGKVFLDDPKIARLVAPNVPRAIKAYSDADLVRLLRHGVRPNGRGVAAMPSAMFYHLDDTDLGALIAYVRSLPEPETVLPATSIRLLARVGLVIGQYELEPHVVARNRPRVRNGPDLAARGHYLAMSSCTECHGQQLQGGRTTPALSIVRGYSAAEFARLMREGIPKDGRERPLMTRTARNRFSHFSDDEVHALYTFLAGSSVQVEDR